MKSILNWKLFRNKKFLRRALLTLLIFLVAMAQNVPWLPAIFGVSALPLLPLVIAVAALDQALPGVLFGAIAGLLWDVSSASAIPHAIYLTIAAFACAMLMRYVLIRNRLTVGLLMFLTTAGYLLLRWGIDCAGLEGGAWVLLRFSLPSLVYTMLLAPLTYLLTQSIVRRTSRKPKASLPDHLRWESEAANN